MRRLFVLLTGGLGLGVVWRRLRRRPWTVEPELDHAAALRSTLAVRKALVEEEPEVSVDPVPSVLDPASRRRAIQDRARGAMDELG
jgi:hypothetical protein